MMLRQAMNAVMYTAIFSSLVLIDYVLGNGFVAMTQRSFCKIFCFFKKAWKEEAKLAPPPTPNNISLSMLLMEVVTLSLTMMVLNKYKYYRGRDRIDELLDESKESLRQTNEFLEKWRVRRQASDWEMSAKGTYLDDEPQEIQPLTLEVPILHMAIVDTLGTTRSQPERGDAGDTINRTDSTLLSMTSLLDNDFRLSAESIADDYGLDASSDSKTVEFRNRYLWDVMEEDSSPDD
ncbi:hypothetical protein MSG28_012004 [Choristoneura fumiferana]|uniref:Uncharacterized protein n=1 Tax=Choristoneura fumiferana TaxID=7141 RepID=A0ACC0KMH8_CHOFU|nr:hypothetical protein MSG28_012004 [Choristoneura fumiferana]